MESYHQIVESLQKIKRAEERLSLLIENKSKLEIKVRERKIQLDKEVEDVEKLEGMSLLGFVHLLKGTLIDQLDKEEREAMIAKNHYEFSVSELSMCIDEIRLTQERISEKPRLERSMQELLSQYQERLLEENTEQADDIKRLIDDEFYTREVVREIREAEEAGQHLLEAFSMIVKSFKNAGGLGIIDILDSGLLVSDATSDSVNTANERLTHLQQDIAKYHLELIDVFNCCDLELDMCTLNMFSENFLDGMMAHRDLKNKMTFAIQAFDNTISCIRESLEHLKVKKVSVLENLETITMDKRKIIELTLES